jgi:hypothetical protein
MAAAILTAAVLAGCSRNGRPGAPGPSVIATVGDRRITLDEFFVSARSAAGEDPKNVSPRVLSSLLDQYLEEVLLDRAVASAQPQARPPPSAGARTSRAGRGSTPFQRPT